MEKQQLFDGSLSPGAILRYLMEEKPWTQEELALVTGRSRKTIQEIASDKSGITPEMAMTLAAAFGTDAADWLRVDALYRLSQVAKQGNASDVERRVRLFRVAPVRDMQRRGWIRDTPDPRLIEKELCRFFGLQSMDTIPTLSVATRRTVSGEGLTASQVAWCMRARQMATALQVGPFDQSRLEAAARELRTLAAYPKEARHLPKVMGKYGIRFVVVEPLPGSKIDGAAFWLAAAKPAIAVSVRFDRIDALWHTVFHEFIHIVHGDALSIDTALVGEDSVQSEDEVEARANREAAAALIPEAEIDSFIRRVGPLYSRSRIVQFAHRVKIHPGIVVGALQHRGEVGWQALREFLVKIRESVVGTALTDGWGHSISPDML